MQVTNEIRQAFLFAALNLGGAFGEKTLTHGANKDCPDVRSGKEKFCKGHTEITAQSVDKITIQVYLNTAFEATETDELMKWLTLQEKVTFGRKLLELTAGRDLNSDLTEDR